MQTWALIATAVALAMDAFAVAVTSGISLRKVSGRQTFRLSWHFGLFQALMPVAGWGLGLTVYAVIAKIDHWVAFALLVFIGGRMIRDSFRKHGSGFNQPDPTRGGTMVLLSVATSIDALAVGFSLSLLRISIWWPAFVIGLVAGSFTAVGLHIGRFLGANSRLGRYSELAGGLVLLGIGLNILHEHRVF